jgi:signal transduction histidine kinase
MTIRNRLAIQFTVLVGVSLAVLLSTIYFFAYQNYKTDFFLQLEERATISAFVYLEEDEVNKSLFKSFEKKYEQKLEEEIIQIYDLNFSPVFIKANEKIIVDTTFLRNVLFEGKAQKSENGIQHYGIFYEDNQGEFIIVASAYDKFGQKKLRNLAIIMFSTFLFNTFLVYILGRLFSIRALRPISVMISDIQQISSRKLHLRLRTGEEQDEIYKLAVIFNNMLDSLEEAFHNQKIFVSNASHELRTPLAAIIGEAELMLNKERSSEEYKDTLKRLLTEAVFMNDLITSLLQLANTQNQEQGNITFEEIRIDELMLELNINLMNKYSSGKISFDFQNLPDDADNLIIVANKSLLYRAFYNIIENAIKFSEEKKVTVTVNFSTKNEVEIIVKDEGIGIAQEDIEKVFQPFYRAGNARRFSGQGIGLALSNKIFKLHKGITNIESQVGVGTTFRIVLQTKEHIE